jgi:hypothetical protein
LSSPGDACAKANQAIGTGTLTFGSFDSMIRNDHAEFIGNCLIAI